ncbi:Domain of unknown function DUF1814 [Thermodesulfatator indicus DSM 15286]|uniref:Nucleotidyl transferase AbiEii toxin, Type IV TA system n=1 Tax=Thermodesulfatator indicus (strain DSM 15286 / JCM 11887 / CIR29812) TaxID=667014 RepID=F8ABK0_THEID|nr:nucleotidyl transferase AbiEii/AbiGii toxin family protein [Thermodesulfatator indicus]AEH45597.1 Domain of unknown function DUF1814 [Thermodesulfatator indicus DSM 15286]
MKKLSKEQKIALELLAKSGVFKKFYLTGGTALTLKYDHRISEDLDLFTLPQFAEDNFPAEEIINEWSKWGEVETISKGTIQGRITEVLVSFFSYPYPLIKDLENLKLNNMLVSVSSDEDLIATKAIAIIQRGQKKDFFDFYFLLAKRKWNLADVVDFCQKKYISFKSVEKNLLKALTYFNDAEGQQVLINKKQVLTEKEWLKIKQYFENLVFMYSKNFAK